MKVDAILAGAPLLGELLVASGWVSQDAVQEALERQKQRNRRLGELLVEMGLLDQAELTALLDLQQRLRAARPSDFATVVGRRLGSILLQSACVTEEQLERAVREQETSGTLLGEVLVRQGALASEMLHGALAFQRALRPDSASPLALGRLLLDAGVVSEEVLAQALERQRITGKRLGELLRELGALSEDQLETFLGRQRKLMAAAVAGVNVMAGTLAPSAAAAADTATARLTIHVTVLQYASISGMSVPSALVVTAEDIARGYIDLSQPVTIDIRTNNPRGVILGFSVRSPLVKSVQLAGVQGELRVSPGGVSLLVPKQGKGLGVQSVSMRARVELMPEALPGIIASPLAVFLAPA